MTKADSGSCGLTVVKRTAARRAKPNKPAGRGAPAAKSKPKVTLSRLLECPFEDFVELVKKPANRLPGLLHALADGDENQLHRDVDKKLVKLLSKRTGVVLTERNVDGETALHRLAGRGDGSDDNSFWDDQFFKEVVRTMCRRPAGVSGMTLRDNQGRTPLFRSLQADNRYVAEAILQSCPDTAAVPDHDGDYPLHVAVQKQYQWADVIKALVEAYPSATKKVDRNGNFALHSASASYSGDGDMDGDEDTRIEVFDVIADANPAALEAENSQGDTVLHSACRFQHYVRRNGVVDDVFTWQSLPHIIKRCCPDALNLPNKNGQTPFHLLVSNCARLAPIEYILKVKGDAPRILDNFGNLPLHCMGKDTSFATAERLLSAYPAAISVINQAGELPLIAVTSSGASRAVVHTLARFSPDAFIAAYFAGF